MADGNLPEVETREIPGFGGYYRAEANGTIWTCRKRGGGKADARASWRRINGRPHVRSGHLEIPLKKPGDRKRLWKVHHLILWTFVGPAPPGLECRHLNGKPADNRIENLKWGTRRENVHDAIAHGTFVSNVTNRFDESRYAEIEAALPSLDGMTLKGMAAHLGVPLWLINYIKYRRKKERVSA